MATVTVGMIVFGACNRLEPHEVEGDADNRKFLEAATGKYQQLLTQDPGNFPALEALGWNAIQKGDYRLAIDQFNRSLRLNSGNASAYLGLGTAYEAMGQLEFAAKTYHQATQLRPDWQYAQFRLGRAYHLMGKPEEAKQQFGILSASDTALANQLLEIMF